MNTANASTDHALATSKKCLESYLEKGDLTGGHRSKTQALLVLPAVKADLGLTADEYDEQLLAFIIDVILGAAWYRNRTASAEKEIKYYLWWNVGIVIGLPIFIAGIGTIFSWIAKDKQVYTVLISQLTSVLTGVFALQKTLSAWYAQRQNYAGWYKCGSDLREIYYKILDKWSSKVATAPEDFKADLAASQGAARHIMEAERNEYYTRLALPSFDILDILTASQSKVATFVTALVPTGPKTEVAAIGTKTLVKTQKLDGPEGKSETNTLAADKRNQEDHAASSEGKSVSSLDAGEIGSLLQLASFAQDTKLPVFDQSVVDACNNLSLTKCDDIIGILGGHGSFFSWYNDTFKGNEDVKERYPSKDTSSKRANFVAFWDQIRVIFDKPQITAIEFCALMAINLEESNGDLSSAPEKMNGMAGPHPGLAYAFDRIKEKRKKSYNQSPNKTVLSLLRDERFVAEHAGKAGAQGILKRPGGIDPRWGGDVWPSDVRADVDTSKNGFVMESDFYKFRGRGIIQTTWRSDYQLLIEWMLNEGSTVNANLKKVADNWNSKAAGLTGKAKLEAIATISSNGDWDAAFAEAMVLAKGVEIDSVAKGDYLNSLASSVDDLEGDKKHRGSLYYFAAHVNGGDYPDRVVPIMKALMRGVAETNGIAALARAPREPEPEFV